jgi:hypothetical protein
MRVYFCLCCLNLNKFIFFLGGGGNYDPYHTLLMRVGEDQLVDLDETVSKCTRTLAFLNARVCV